jgi:hypothetical protein
MAPVSFSEQDDNDDIVIQFMVMTLLTVIVTMSHTHTHTHTHIHTHTHTHLHTYRLDDPCKLLIRLHFFDLFSLFMYFMLTLLPVHLHDPPCLSFHALSCLHAPPRALVVTEMLPVATLFG